MLSGGTRPLTAAELIGDHALRSGETGVATTRYPYVDVRRYGATGNGVTDDTAALRKAIAASQQFTLYRGKAAGDVGATSYSTPEIRLRSGTYIISDELEIANAIRIVAEGPVFLKQTNPAKRHFTSPGGGAGYLTLIRGIHFIGGLQAIRMVRPNADTSMNVIEDCTFSANDPTQFALEFELRSGHLVVRGCRVLDAPRFLKATDCDMVLVDDSWINGYAASTDKKPADSASFDVRGVAGANNKFIIRNTLLIPEPEVTPANANTRWIDLHNHVSLELKDTQFGGENGGFPIVYNFGSAAVHTVYPYTGCGGISVSDCQVAAGASARADRGVVVLRTAAPARIEVRDCYGLNDGYVVNDSQMIDGGGAPLTPAAWLASVASAQAPIIDWDITVPMGWGSSALSSTAFNTFARVRSGVTIGGGSRETHPRMTVRERFYAPALPAVDVLTLAGSGNGLVVTDEGNGWLVYQSGGALYYLRGTSGLAVPTAARRSVSANTTALWTDRTLLVDSTAGVRTITLPVAAGTITDGQEIVVVRSVAGANNVNVVVSGGANFGDGTATVSLTALGQYARFQWDAGAGKWWRVG